MKHYKLSTPLMGMDSITFSLNQEIGTGANAIIYKEKIGQNYFAFKKYKQSIKPNYNKIQCMIQNLPTDIYNNNDSKNNSSYAWPLSLVIEKNNNKDEFIGYIMEYIESNKAKTLNYFYDKILSKKLIIQTNLALSNRVELLKNLCSAINKLHEMGHIFVDLKPQNILADEQTRKIFLLDCDGYSIFDKKNNKIFKESGVSPDYIPPELFKENRDDFFIGKEQDNYSLAVICFQMLNDGIHPFQGQIKNKNIQANTNDEKAYLGLYPYGKLKHPEIEPKKESIHRLFLDETNELFNRAFSENKNRPSPKEWEDHFTSILDNKGILECKKYGKTNFLHMRFKDKECPTCYLERISLSRKNNKSNAKNLKINSNGNNQNNINLKSTNSSLLKTGSIFLLFIIGFLFIIILNQNSLNSNQTSSQPNPTINSSNQQTEKFNDTELCQKALSKNSTNWDNSSFDPDVYDAKKRGLNIDSCLRLVPQQNIKPYGSDLNIRNLSNRDICQKALSTSAANWDSSQSYSDFVTEAKRRNLDINSCRLELGLSPSNQKTAIDLNNLSNSKICDIALNYSKDDWNSNNSFEVRNFIEARNLSINSCRNLFGLTSIYKLCNQTNDIINVAIGFWYSSTQESYGWYQVLPQECKPMQDNVPGNRLYYFAKNTKYVWETDDADKKFCINEKDKFNDSRPDFQKNCKRGLVLKNFYLQDISKDNIIPFY